MGLTDFTGGSAPTPSGVVSSIQTLVSGQVNPLTALQTNISGMSFLVARGAGPLTATDNPASSLSGFAFDFYTDDEFELNVDATDHWAEDNSSIQDHAAVLPITARLSGFVGEFVIPNPNAGLGGALRQLEQKMATVGAYAGSYTPGTLQAISGKVTGALATAQGYVQQVSAYAQQAQNLLNIFKPAGATRQQNALAILSSAAISRQTFTLFLPWMSVGSVLITNVRATQTGETTSKTEISIGVKQIRTVPIVSAPIASATP
jgi:hypothetical protein